MRADRLLRLLMLLQRRRRATAPELAAELEVSVRTVLRDMDALSAAGVPVYTERGKGGGCVLLDGFRTDATGLTPTEAQALFSWAARDSATELGMHHDLSAALAKVAASTPSAALAQAESFGDVIVTDRRTWFGEPEQVAHLPALRTAVTDRRRIRVRYRSAGAASAGTRTLDPIGLVDQAGRWYLVAEHRGRPRSLRVSRVERVTILPEPVRITDIRPLADVWRDLRAQFHAAVVTRLDVELAVEPQVADGARTVFTAQLTGNIEELSPLADGRLHWRLTLRNRKTAIGMAVALAPGVEVLAPPDLRAEIAAAAGACRQIYE